MDLTLLPLCASLPVAAWLMLAPDRRPRLRLRRPTRPVNAIEDMLATKTRIRQEERQRWADHFEDLAGEPWRAEETRRERRVAVEARAQQELDRRTEQQKRWAPRSLSSPRPG